MAKITMVDVSRDDYQVKVDKAMELLDKGAWVMDHSGSLIHNIIKKMPRDSPSRGDGKIIKTNPRLDDKEFLEEVIREVKMIEQNQDEIPVLIINAGKLFWQFSRTLWSMRKSESYKSATKNIKTLLVDIMERLSFTPFIKKCIIFNGAPGKTDIEMMMDYYPRNVKFLERDGTVQRVPVTELVV